MPPDDACTLRFFFNLLPLCEIMPRFPVLISIPEANNAWLALIKQFTFKEINIKKYKANNLRKIGIKTSVGFRRLPAVKYVTRCTLGGLNTRRLAPIYRLIVWLFGGVLVCPQTFSHTVMCKVCLTASNTLFDADAFVRLNHWILSNIWRVRFLVVPPH